MEDPMTRPFLYMTIPLILGIVFTYVIEPSVSIIMMLLGFQIVFFIINLIKSKTNTFLLFSMFFILGSILTSYNLKSSILIKHTGKEMTLDATVEEVLRQDEEEGRYIVRVNSIFDGVKHINTKEKTVLKIIGANDINLGYRVKFNGKLNIPQRNTNPMLFNYRLNLLTNKIYTTSTIKNYSIVEIDSTNISLKHRMKANFTNKIEESFDNNLKIKNSSLMKSIVLGEYSYLQEDDISKYRDLGLAHILAVSGLHIGIIAGFILFVLANIGVKKSYNVLVTLSIIWTYGFLIGFPPSLLRANIMINILFISQLQAEAYDIYNSLSFAAFILLLINPLWIFNLGFQLSFLATLSIVVLTPRIREIFYPYKNKIIYLLSATLGVQIGLLPIQAYYFNRIPIISILSNLIIAPILSFCLIVGGLMVGSSYFLPILNFPIGKFLDIILDVQAYLVSILSKVPWGNLKIHSPSILEIIIYYISILIIIGKLNFRHIDRKINKLIFYYLIVSLGLNLTMLMNDKSLEIHFIDVGQGDAILLRTRKASYLVDTGGSIMDSFDIGKNITLPYLEKLGVRNIDALFISHFDDDHCKSVPLLLENINIKNIFIPYQDPGNDIYKAIKESKTPILLSEGDGIKLNKDIRLDIMSPSESMRRGGYSSNNLSQVFLLSYHDKKILFTGDMEKETEKEIGKILNYPIDIIKVPHHGSNTSSTEEFLEKIKPRVGIISVGRNNFYGHPKDEIVKRYLNGGTQLYRTDEEGLIKVNLNKDKMEIKPFIEDNKDFLSILVENYLLIIFYLLYYLISYILINIYRNLEMELNADEL